MGFNSAFKELILTFLFLLLWRHVLLQLGITFTVAVAELVLYVHPHDLLLLTF